MIALRATLLSVVSGTLIAFLALPQDALAARESRPVGEFSGVTSHGPFEVHVRQAERSSVDVEADETVLPLIETVVEPGDSGPVLHLRVRRGARLMGLAPVKVHVTTAQLRSLDLRGSGDLHLAAFQTPVLSLSVSGSGNAHAKALTTQRLVLSIAGSGYATADGRADRLSVSIAGSGHAKLRELPADQVEVNIAGSGNVQVNAQKSLTVTIAGSGDVGYLGSPSIKSNVMGSGSVKAIR